MQDVLSDPDERVRIANALGRILADPNHGPGIRTDLREGWSALPIWMQTFLRDLFDPSAREDTL
jgi:hypothetical protein